MTLTPIRPLRTTSLLFIDAPTRFRFFVMAGLRPGHPRLSSEFSQDVDARDKPGHDEPCGKPM
jgi:hypothetical protein